MIKAKEMQCMRVYVEITPRESFLIAPDINLLSLLATKNFLFIGLVFICTYFKNSLFILLTYNVHFVATSKLIFWIHTFSIFCFLIICQGSVTFLFTWVWLHQFACIDFSPFDYANCITVGIFSQLKEDCQQCEFYLII